MPIRVLQVVTKMDNNGLETLIMNWYRNINREKVQFDFLVHREEEGAYDQEILELGGRIYSVPSINPFHHRKYLNKLDAFFEEYREYNIVHSHINTYSMWPLRSAKKAGVPIRLAHSHISNVPLDYKTPFRLYTKSRLNNFTTDNFACSAAAGEWLFGKNHEFRVLNNAIDSKKYIFNTEARKKIRQEMNIENEFVIGHIGRFSKQKNHTFIIKIFHEVLKYHPDSKLILVGEGDLKNEILKLSKELGIFNRIIFTGVRNDVEDLLQSMDVFLFPSIYEGLGIVAVEAQAAGLPTIVSDKIPSEAYVTDLVLENSLDASVETWAESILSYAHPYKRRDTHKEVISNGYDIESNIGFLENFYLRKNREANSLDSGLSKL